MHVTHFAESIIPLWHTFAHPDVYPVHSKADRIFLKQTNFNYELEWNRKLLTFMAYHSKNATVADIESFGQSSLICFEKAGMVGMGLHEYGFFASQNEAHTFRREIIRFYHIPVQVHPSLLYKSRYAQLEEDIKNIETQK